MVRTVQSCLLESLELSLRKMNRKQYFFKSLSILDDYNVYQCKGQVKSLLGWALVVHAFNPSIWEIEAGGSLCEFEASSTLISLIKKYPEKLAWFLFAVETRGSL